MRIGLIGVGMVGAIHARSARQAGAELAGVSARTAAGAEEAARRLGFERAFRNPLELIADDSIDVVHICTPNHLHHELAEAAIAAGRHVVCEKPLATDAVAAEALSAAAAAAGVVAAVPFVYRFYPMVREARARVRRDDLGPIGLINGAYLQDWLAAAGSSDWRVDPALGGPSRAFADIGSHWCDLVEFVSGQRLVAVSAQMRTLRQQRPRAAAGARSFSSQARSDGSSWEAVETEDLAVVAFSTSSEAAGAVVVSQVSPGAKNRLSFELTGAAATLSFQQQSPDTLVLGAEGGSNLLERDPIRLTPEAARYATLPAGHPQGFHDCFDAFVADVYEQIESGGPVDGVPTFADGARAVQITDAVLRSARAGAAWVEVESSQFSTTSADQKTK